MTQPGKLAETLTPAKVVQTLNRYIVGQDKAKRAVAIALRNRIRRRWLSADLSAEIAPKNILMVGPTGVGKTEIARRLASLVDSPFIKVEATKFTEVGYVGRDVESMIRDLAESAIQMVKSRRVEEVQPQARMRAEERLLDALLPRPRKEPAMQDFMKTLMGGGAEREEPPVSPEPQSGTRERLREMLLSGKLDEREVEIEVSESQQLGFPLMGGGMEGMAINLGEALGGLMPRKMRRRKMTVAEALKVLQAEEAEALIDMEAVARDALEKAEEEGIVFLDELDKIAASGGGGQGPDVSREGVQRDLLPIVEGSAVQTKYGPLRTDHVLFIAAGAFHKVKPSDLVPELQGRFPLRVELQPLSAEDLARILVEPEHSLVRQYQALMETEGVEVRFEEDAIREIAVMAARMNQEMEDIGARRLHTIMEILLEEVSFSAPDMQGIRVNVDVPFVKSRLEHLATDTDIRKYLI
ncbi:MAG: ATP-dependent protease ATPase subunit HslU [Synergistales bacterium]|jgi:ATP-dependent HslUV protease ATP-binding subunit HslU